MKERQPDIETKSIDNVSNMEKVWRIAKLVPDHFFILVSSPKQPLHARNCLENKIF